MGTNNVKVKRFNSPEEAPKYQHPEFNYAEIEEIVVVNNGTVGGNSTADLIFKDQSGKKFVAMVTVNLLRASLGLGG